MPEPEQNLGEFFFIDHGANLQSAVCSFISQRFSHQLPDLTHLHILVPAPDLIYTLRRQLLNQLHSQQQTAFIGAEVTPIKKWLEQNTLINQPDYTFINNHARQLIILEALQQYPAHFRDENLWQVSSALLQLFDELTLYHLSIETMSETDWINKIRQLYGLKENNEHLTAEARLIYTLWKAWHQQITDEGLLDQSSAYIQRLNVITEPVINDQSFIIVGAEYLSVNEIILLRSLARSNPVYFFLQASPDSLDQTDHPDHFLKRLTDSLGFKTNPSQFTPKPSLIQRAFMHALPLQQRLTQAATGDEHLKIVASSSEEQEAIAIDIQIRRWLIEGRRNLAVVTENRKLARRIRALLERAGVNLIDSVGWSLSTTSAATVVEKWLECIEQDFIATSLLDFLKSPYFTTTRNNDQHLENVYRFEKDVVLHEQVSANLNRYLHSLELRSTRLQHWESDCYQQVESLLNELSDISTALKSLYISNTKTDASTYLKTLLQSLDQLGLIDALSVDEAGQLIVDEIRHMINACSSAEPDMNWYDFRTWLASAFENHHYSPSSQASHVRLLNLKQSNSGYYQGLIIASADASQLPGPGNRLPVFNHHVRNNLGLPDWQLQKAEKFYLFRRLVQAADDVLITYCREKNNEERQPSPWLQTIIDTYCVNQQQHMLESDLEAYISNGITRVLPVTDLPLPAISSQPAPQVDSSILPDSISSSSHQRLINCPYQFYLANILKLRASDEIITELQKSEYGEKVHRILELFHSEPANNEADFDQALKQLTLLSKNIFSQQIEDNFLHRGWLKRWLDHCEAYLLWQQQHARQWRFKAAEVKQSTAIAPDLQIKGRLDRIDCRIDSTSKQYGIIDYKTSGTTPSQDDVDNGEDVQLSSYALMHENVCQVEYLKLDKTYGQVSSGASISDDQLEDITEQTLNRLIKIFEQLKNAEPMIANGSDEVCNYCDYTGLCRQTYWKQRITEHDNQ